MVSVCSLTARQVWGGPSGSAAAPLMFPVVKAVIGYWESCCVPVMTPGSSSVVRQTAPPCRHVKWDTVGCLLPSPY